MEPQQGKPDAAAHIRLSTEQASELKNDSLGEKLQVMIRSLPDGEVSLAEIMELVGQEGMLLLTAFLTLVFLIPVSVPGVSTVFGAAILLIGISRLLNRNLWLPGKIRHRRLPAAKLRSALNGGMVWVHRLERLSRPHRMPRLSGGGPVAVTNNAAFILGALLLMAPFGLVPFSNTLPALALLFLAVGLLQRDGVCILLGHLTNLATIAYFTFLIAGGGAAIHALFRRFAGQG
jgi:hypothetical protein